MKFIKNTYFSIIFIFISTVNHTLINQKSINIQYPEIYIDNHDIEKRYILKNNISWSFPIKYYVQPPILKENVRKAIELLKDNTCITFQEVNSNFEDGEGLIFTPSHICYSLIGLEDANHPQHILLSLNCFLSPLIILHELGHALGLVHEHIRGDRDDYIKINKDYITESQKQNFEILNLPNLKSFSTGYDHSSLMHYHPYDFGTSNRISVIESKLNKLYLRAMGQNKKMSFNDYKKLNLEHCNECGWVDDSTGERNINNYNNAECLNDGYPDFNNCSKCICPTGFTGDLCGDILPSDAECNQTTFFASSNFTSLVFTGQKTCYIYLKAIANYNIQLFTHYYNAPYENGPCTDDHAYEIKYLKDKGTTGLLLCGHNSITMQLKSKSNTILVIYRGTSGHSLLVFSYREVK